MTPKNPFSNLEDAVTTEEAEEDKSLRFNKK
jgi:hypothetical protein